MSLKSLDKLRFDALCYSRLPIVDLMVEEVEWYADKTERVLGIVQYHRQDCDWCWTVLGRDANGQFRAINCNTSIASKDEARTQLHERMRHHSAQSDAEFFQGDEKKHNTELFEALVPSDKLHPLFKRIQTGHHHSAARGIMQEIANALGDWDGNYVKDFQTTGFNARLWELFLFAFFYEQRFDVLDEFKRPDFCVMKDGFPIGVEAVTVNASDGEQFPSHSTVEERQALCEHYLPIKFGSPLFSKLQKRYWELPHMVRRPLMFAVHDFICDDSMTWSPPALSDYLYGSKAKWWKEPSGKLRIEEVPIEQHSYGTKKIPSGFFQQPGAENIGAVLFTNTATMSKFNRMGKLAGFGEKNVTMIRKGVRYDPDPNADRPMPFEVLVQPGKYSENWSESVAIFHNPNALLPIPVELFPSCAHHFWRDGRRVSLTPEGFVFTSGTLIVAPKDEGAPP